VAGAVDRFGGIDAVVANAGIGNGGLMRYMDPDAFEAVIRVNLIGAYETIYATLPHLIDRRGYLLQICSVAAIAHTPGMAAYSASKSGAEAMANSLRHEVKHHGVDVGTAYFSWIGTEMVFGVEENPIGEKMRSSLRGPLAKTYPAAAAADSIIQGIEERRRVVVTPKWVRPLLAAKTLVQRIVDTRAGELVPEVEQMTRDEIAKRGDEVWVPSGAGGKAFAEADRARERAAG
jgi:short-subunit dehydrogenase